MSVVEDVNLGMCMLSADVPFSGMALDIFNRRVQGTSWKQIADEFNLGTPSKARSTFTKMTGITDYQIKGPDLLKLAQGGLDDKLVLSKAQKTALKQAKKPDAIPEPVNIPSVNITNVDNDLAELMNALQDNPDWLNAGGDPWQEYLNTKNLTAKEMDWVTGQTKEVMFPMEYYSLYQKFELDDEMPGDLQDYVAATKQAAKKVTKDIDPKGSPDLGLLQHPQANNIYNLHQQGNGYLKITQQTGLSHAEVDDLLWNRLLKDADGNVWHAYLGKPGSQKGFDAVKDMVFAQRKAGLTLDEVAKITGVDPKVVNAVKNGQWQLPSPGTNTYYVPTSYTPSPSTHSYAKQQDWGSTDFPRLSSTEMQTIHPPMAGGAAVNAMRRYTGSMYRNINMHLRGSSKGDSRIEKSVTDMDKGMVPSTRSFTVSRGMNRSGFGMGHMSDIDVENLTGVIVRDRGFMSTSISEVFGGEIRFVIEAPVGTRGHWVQPFSNHPGEQEYLLNRDSKIMINKVERHGSGWRVFGRVIV